MNSRTTTFYRAATVAAAAVIVATAAGMAAAGSGAGAAPDPYASMPSLIKLSGTIRDFKGRTETGGHSDFELQPASGYGHYMGEVKDQLDADGKPVFGSAGYLVSKQWADATGRSMMSPRSYVTAKTGDKAGAMSSTTGGALTNGEKFGQWYRDVPGVNMAQALDITLVRQAGTNRYVFDDTADSAYTGTGGFFPINGKLYGNYASTGKNFHFTYELDTQFTYEKDKGHVFTFVGDDDVWVFVDGKMVIDLGGVHGKTSQTVELDRLNWLENGKTYSLKFFFAERHTTQSNFRIETTLNLRSVEAPSSAALYD